MLTFTHATKNETYVNKSKQANKRVIVTRTTQSIANV